MKILILVNHELTLYNFRQELLKLLVSEGHEVVIAMPTGQYDGLFKEFGCRVVPVELSQHGMNPMKDFKLPGMYRKLMKKEQPDVVLTYTIKPNIYGGMAAGRCKLPCISTVTGLGSAFEKGSIISKISYMLYRLGTRKTACIFFQNEGHSRLFAEHKVAVGRHCVVAGSGVNLQKHCFEEYPQGDDVRLMFVGRVTKDKGIDELIEAMKAVKEQAQVPVSLELLGNIEEGYEDVVASCEKEGLLVSHGRHDNVHDYVKTCSAVVLPSYHEGLANVLLEAAACGRPVLASDINGCKETFEEGVSGLGFAARDAQALTEVLLRFVAMPWQQRAEMGAAGRKKVEEEYDREKVNQTYLEKMKELTGK